MHLLNSFSDIDECAMDPCDTTATCRDTNGSFVCTCISGFTGDRFNCLSENGLALHTKELLHAAFLHADIDECELFGPCDANATCVDTSGSFVCTCDGGFTGDGFTCSSKLV